MILVSAIRVRELWIPAFAGIQRSLLVAETMIDAYFYNLALLCLWRSLLSRLADWMDIHYLPAFLIGTIFGPEFLYDEESVMLKAYRQHVEERQKEGVPPLPLSAAQTAELAEFYVW